MQQRKENCIVLVSLFFCLLVFTFCFLGDQEASSIGEESCRMEDMETAEPDSTTVNSKVTSSFLLLLTFVSSPVGYRTVPLAFIITIGKQIFEICKKEKELVADPHHLDADLESGFLFSFGSGPDFSLLCGSGSCSSFKLCESVTIGLQTLHGSNLSLHASIASVHGLPWLHFEPLRLLNDSNADP